MGMDTDAGVDPYFSCSLYGCFPSMVLPLPLPSTALPPLLPSALPVVLEHFEQIVGDCFMDCVNCLMAFANNIVSPRISLKAIALLRICEDRLAEVRVGHDRLAEVCVVYLETVRCSDEK